MDLEVVTVGTELLLGYTLDSNAADIARSLAPIGVRVVRRTTVGDDEAAIRQVVVDCLERTGFVILTGGLGPTRDDVTKKAVARVFDAPLDLDSDYLELLQERFARLGRGPMPGSNRSQAEIPRGAVVLTNPRGTAPGLWLDGALGIAILLPGIPNEMRGILQREVIPRMRDRLCEQHGPLRVTKSRTLRTTGVSESKLAECLAVLEPALGAVSLAYLPGVDGVDLRLTAWEMPQREVDGALDSAVDLLRPALGSDFYGEGDVDLAGVVLERLRDARMCLAVAESCTGGGVGARLTAVPGSSDVFAGGVISYSDSSKIRDLGVSKQLISEHGAVSLPVAEAMVHGVRDRFATDAAVATTGIAGPGGGTPEKPVGTVCVAACLGEHTRSLKRWFPGRRPEVRDRSAQAALDLMRRLLERAA
jgi:nicotinamide-nucleotide amidase